MPTPRFTLKRLLLPLLLFAAWQASAQTQGTDVAFGRSRVQYKTFFWQYYSFRNFDIYYYEGGRELALRTAKIAEPIIAEMQQQLNNRQDGRFQFIIYPSQADAVQSNLGQNVEQYNTGGVTPLNNNKVVLAFDGNRARYAQTIRREVGRVLITDLLYGGNLQEMLQNNNLLFLPDWYVPGLLDYLAEGWTVERDGQLRALELAGKLKKFNKFAAFYPDPAGVSFWHYVAQAYGYPAVANILYLTRVNRDFDAAAEFVLGKRLKEINKEWALFYAKLYAGEERDRFTPRGAFNGVHLRRRETMTDLRIAPNGKQAAFATHRDGLDLLWLYDFATKKRTLLHTSGLHFTPTGSAVHYPVFAWHPNGKSIGFFYKKDAVLRFGNLHLEEKDPKRRFQESFVYTLDDVLSADYADDGQTMALAGASKGQSDIYLFKVASKGVVPVTQDGFDDASPRFLPGTHRLLFTSTRTADTLIYNAKLDTQTAQPQPDIFAYDWKARKPRVSRLTYTPTIAEYAPMALAGRHFAYLSAPNGIINRFIGRLDSVPYRQINDTTFLYRDTATALPATNYLLNIVQQQYDPRNRYLVEGLQTADRIQFYIDSTRVEEYLTVGQTLRPTKTHSGTSPLPKPPPIPVGEVQQSQSMTIYTLDHSQMQQAGAVANPAFPIDSARHRAPSLPAMPTQTAPPDTATAIPADTTPKAYVPFYQIQTDLQDWVANPEQAKPLRAATSNASSAALDAAMAAQNQAPDSTDAADEDGNTPNGKANAKNLLKARVYSPVFSSSYVVTQLDNTLLLPSYPRFSNLAFNSFNPGLNGFFKFGATDLLENYRFTGGFRTNFNFTSNEYFLQYENLKKRWDKSILVYQQGRRLTLADDYPYKSSTQIVQLLFTYPFSRQTSVRLGGLLRRDAFNAQSVNLTSLRVGAYSTVASQLQSEYIHDNTVEKLANIRYGTRYKVWLHFLSDFNKKSAFTGIVGVDYRKYVRVGRTMVWATRVAGAESFGPQRVAYYLGGVNNWLSPKTDYTNRIDPGINYQYEALATNMRGFSRNVRNGSSYVVLNSEFRLPLLASIIRTPIGSDFLRSIQLVAFVDVGSAWVGLSPLDRGNSFNTQVYENQAIRVRVTNNRDPFVYGFGPGIRTRLFGYFVRGDVAWGWQDQVLSTPKLSLSLGLDF